MVLCQAAERELSLARFCSPFRNHQFHLECWERVCGLFSDVYLAEIASPLATSPVLPSDSFYGIADRGVE
jgi:hypothetical protein